jgi:hypothetical protein
MYEIHRDGLITSLLYYATSFVFHFLLWHDAPHLVIYDIAIVRQDIRNVAQCNDLMNFADHVNSIYWLAPMNKQTNEVCSWTVAAGATLHRCIIGCLPPGAIVFPLYSSKRHSPDGE